MKTTVEYEIIDRSGSIIRLYVVQQTDGGMWRVFCDTDDRITSNGHETEQQAMLIAMATARYWRDTYQIKTGESCAIRVHRM